MSFLAGRLAVSERKYFREESGAKANELRRKKLLQEPREGEGAAAAAAAQAESETGVSGNRGDGGKNLSGVEDMLPEVLMHSVPLSFRDSSSSSIPAGSVPKGFSAIEEGGTSRAAAGGATGVPRLKHLHQASVLVVPQTRLGPAKYNLIFPEASSAGSPSTANEQRQLAAASAAAARSRAQQAAAAAEGFLMVSKAFGIATLIVYGGAAIGLGLGMRALGITQVEDIPVKGREFVAPKVEALHRRFEPLKERLNSAAERWRMSEEQRKAVGHKYAEVLGAPDKK